MSDIILDLQSPDVSGRGSLDCFSAPPMGEPECPRHSTDGRTKNKRGRPRITDDRPWDIEGISRSTYYERLASPPRVTPAYVPDIPLWAVIAFWGQAEPSTTTELTRIGYETYLPLRAIERQDPVTPSMWHVVRVPLFSGYGFIRLTQSESRQPITETRGVREVLRRPDGRLASVSEVLIEALRDDDENRLKIPKESSTVLDVDTRVRIAYGPFLSHIGKVVQCDGRQTQVELNIFGRPTPIWFDRVSVAGI